MDTIALIEASAKTTGALVKDVPDDAWGKPSPCAEFDTKAVLNHLVGAMHGLGGALREEAPPEGDDHLGDDPKGAYATATKAAIEAAKAPGALEKQVKLAGFDLPGQVAANIMVLEQYVHGWDISRATGLSFDPAEDVSSAVLEVAKQIIQPALREQVGFGPEVEIAADAPMPDRVAAFTGRTP